MPTPKKSSFEVEPSLADIGRAMNIAMTATDSVRLAHLQRLEAEAIHVMREAVAEAAELIVQRLFDDYNEVTI